MHTRVTDEVVLIVLVGCIHCAEYMYICYQCRHAWYIFGWILAYSSTTLFLPLMNSLFKMEILMVFDHYLQSLALMIIL